MVREDISIDWAQSPRIVTVAAPSVEVDVQDLLDTLRTREAEAANMDEPAIIDASGKEPLGGGVSVGLTVTLLNAKVAFAARSGPTWTLCTIRGGNLVAFDADGQEMDARQPTAYVSVDRVSASSATLVGQTELPADVAESVWTRAIESGFTAEQLMRLISAVLFGEVSGAEGLELTFKSPAGSKDRVIATVDGDGNRTALDYDATP